MPMATPTLCAICCSHESLPQQRIDTRCCASPCEESLHIFASGLSEASPPIAILEQRHY